MYRIFTIVAEESGVQFKDKYVATLLSLGIMYLNSASYHLQCSSFAKNYNKSILQWHQYYFAHRRQKRDTFKYTLTYINSSQVHWSTSQPSFNFIISIILPACSLLQNKSVVLVDANGKFPWNCSKTTCFSKPHTLLNSEGSLIEDHPTMLAALWSLPKQIKRNYNELSIFCW